MLNIPVYKFKAFSFDDSINSLLDMSNQYGFSHLPVIEKGIYRGMIRCDDVMDILNKSETIRVYQHLIEKIYASDRMNWTSLLSIMMKNETNVIGTLNLAGKYIGVRLLDDILNLITEKIFTNENGYVLVVKKQTADFSISQVAQIVESNNGVVLGILVNQIAQETEVEIKIKTEDINEIIQTFRRYDYEIITQFEEDLHLQELKEHSDFLRRYLEMGN